MALGIVLAYWPLSLALALLALVTYAVAAQGQQQKQRQLKELVATDDRWFRHDPFRVRGRFGVIQSISLAGDLFTPRLDILSRTIAGPSS